MRTLMSAMVVACLVAPWSARASEVPEPPRHEVWLGLGGGTSLESDIFNVADDVSSEPEMLISFGYLFNFDARDAIGFNVYGGTETLPDFFLLPPGAITPVPVSFDLDTFNIGLRLRHAFTRGRFAPYGWLGLNLASGTVSSAETGDLDYSGYSVGVGPGVLIALSSHLSVSVEGVASFGSAKWKSEPFSNSTSRDFNPGLLGVIVNLGFGWGRVQ